MMSLPKTIKNADVRETSQIIYHSKGLDESYPKMQVLSNLSNFFKSYEYLSEIFGVFTTSTHQIWLNHVTPGANFGNLLLSPSLALNFGKSYQSFDCVSLLLPTLLAKNLKPGGKYPPVLIGLIEAICHKLLQREAVLSFPFIFKLLNTKLFLPQSTQPRGTWPNSARDLPMALLDPF